MRAFQFFNLNKEEDRQEFFTLATNFLDKLIGSDTRSDVDTRGIVNGILEDIGMIFQNTFGLVSGLLDNIFVSRALMPNEYNVDQMRRKIEIETILELLPEFILQTIAGLVETPCVFAKLIAADNELIGDACEFFQNLDE